MWKWRLPNVYFVSASVCWIRHMISSSCYPNITFHWRHNGRYVVSNHQPRDCLLNRLFSRRSKKTSKLCVTGLCVGNSSATGEFPAQRASNTENASVWWRFLGKIRSVCRHAHISTHKHTFIEYIPRKMYIVLWLLFIGNPREYVYSIVIAVL